MYIHLCPESRSSSSTARDNNNSAPRHAQRTTKPTYGRRREWASDGGGRPSPPPHIHSCIQVRDAISGCHPSLHAPLAAAVTLAGGTSMLPGLATRLAKELTKAAPAAWAVAVHRGGRAHRSHRTWMGGALVASLPMLSELSVSRQVLTLRPAGRLE
jgi:hypothetical protein